MNIVEYNVPKSRILFIDNIRLTMIIIVVLVHTSVTYSGIGGWYYIENKSVDTVSKIIFAIFNTFSQSYFMGFLFLIAGYFIPKAYDKKGAGKFIKDRIVRLGLPVIIYIFVIHPFIEYFIMGIFIDKPVQAFNQYYINYIKPFGFLGNTGPLWFALALLIFTLIYALVRRNFKQSIKLIKYPNHLSIILIILLISFLNFVVRIFQPFGTSIMNMQLCFFSQYIILFIIGILAYRNNWFANLPYEFGVFWLKVSLGLGLVLWLLIMLFAGPLAGKEYVILGGLYWQSAVYAFWEQLVCVGMCLGLIVIFRDKFNYQGKVLKFLSQNAFSVYVFHAPILIVISLLLRNIYLYPLIKFIFVALIVLPISFSFSYLIRRVPVLKKLFS
ncbi:MAG: acyltransferase family protein [Clostridium sp.]|uniref:acyltransferase family protein n=1 Tax=Clostridium sp. TaxID=1506 RepID=UPI0039E7C4A4